ncbi:MAG: hypothetical protein J6X28_04330 [Bacilli bacterium]|nr:hypothetical protein [Bacilli bacterium]
MNLSLLGKLGVIFHYIFSSFLSLEMFLISLLLFIILIYNLKRNNRLVQIVAIGIYLGFVIGIFVSYTTYVQSSINSFVKEIMNYIYFPSTIIYFFIIVFVTIMMIYTLFSKKLSLFKKIVNFSVFSILYFFFMSFLTLSAYDGYDLVDMVSLYENDVILSLVQVSNLLLFVWLLFTGFYHLYLYFKKKYDQ